MKTNISTSAARLAVRSIGAITTLFYLSMGRAYAQVMGGGLIGADAWNSIKGLWFGPAGLILGVMVFGLAVYFFFKDGVLAVMGVLAIGTFFFFVPAVVTSIQSWARSF